MKTTFDLPEPLLRDVQRLAKQRGTTARSLVEQALAQLLEQAHQRPPYQLADRAVAGDGLTPEFADSGWAELRDAAYGVR